jgi:hypothetical protein
MNPARRPAPRPPAASSSVESSRSSFSSTLNHSTTLEPIKTPSGRIVTNNPVQGSPQSTATLPTTVPASATVHRTIKVVEPIREKLEKDNCNMDSSPKQQRKSTANKIIGRIGDGLGFVCYLLCMCCVLSGGHPPATKKSKRGYYYQYDDEGFRSPEPAPRVKKIHSPNNNKNK